MSSSKRTDPERTLAAMIDSAIELGAEGRLRLFAVWCARQTGPRNALWDEAVNLVEEYVLGFEAFDRVVAARSRLSNAASAACCIGFKVGAPNAAALLTCIAAMRDDARSSVLDAARNHVKWGELCDRQGSREGERTAPRIATIQVERLERILSAASSVQAALLEE